MSNIDKFKALGAKAAAEGADQTKTVSGGERTVLAAGPCRLRFVSYVEMGKHSKQYAGSPAKIQNEVRLGFEISGPKHPPKVDESGNKTPNIIYLEENLSLNEKARFKKLFGVMNYAGSAQHMVQLLGEAYKGTIVHRKYAKRGEDKSKPESWTGIEAELFNKATGAFTIEAPRYEVVNPDDHEEPGPTGEYKVLQVAAPLSPLVAFLWQYADKEQWDSLYIDGTWPERKNDKGEVTMKAASKNVVQIRIKQAVNFAGSPIYNVLAEAGANLDIPDAEAGRDPDAPEDMTDEEVEAAHAIAKAKAASKPVPTGAAADDALNGVV